MEFINIPAKLEVEEDNLKENGESTLLEHGKELTLKQALDVYFANTPNSLNNEGNINKPVVNDNTTTYRLTCSKEKSLQPHESAVQNVEEESDVVLKLEQEDHSLSETKGFLTLQEELISQVTGENTRTYRPRHSKEKLQETHASSVQKVEEESDVVVKLEVNDDEQEYHRLSETKCILTLQEELISQVAGDNTSTHRPRHSKEKLQETQASSVQKVEEESDVLVKLEVNEELEENNLTESKEVSTVKEELNAPFVGDNTKTYRHRLSKEKSLQPRALSVHKVVAESDVFSDDCRPRKTSRLRKNLTTMKVDEDDGNEFKPRKRSRLRKEFTSNKVEDGESDSFCHNFEARKRSIPRKKDTTNKVAIAPSKKSKVKMDSIDSAIKARPISKLPDSRAYNCNFCEYIAYNKCALDKHLITHKKIYNFQCDLCTYKSVRKWNLDQHILSHKKISNFKCDLCPYKSVTKWEVTRHIKTVHLNIRRFKCTLCTYAGSASFNLQRHVLNHHAGSKEAESVKLILAERKPRSKPRTLLCEICGYATPHTSTMFRHKRRHEGVKRFICDVCSYETDENFKLERHMKVHKGGTSEARSKIWMHYKRRNRPKGIIKCTICSYSTAHQSCLYKHNQKHKELNPLSCKFCSYATSQMSLLDCHLKKHHNKGVELDDAVQQSDMALVTTPISLVTDDQHIQIAHNNTE